MLSGFVSGRHGRYMNMFPFGVSDDVTHEARALVAGTRQSLRAQSIARWLAFSTPRCRYERAPSGAWSITWTKSSVSVASVETHRFAVIGPTNAAACPNGAEMYVA